MSRGSARARRREHAYAQPMADETTITFAKDDTIIVEEELLSVASKLAAGGFVRFDRGNEAVMVNSANVRYLRSVRRSEGGR